MTRPFADVQKPAPEFAKRLTVGTLMALTFSALVGTQARAQDYPDKPIRLVVAFPAGGPADIAMRIVADRLSTQMERNFVVDNRPGAGGIIGADIVAAAAPDGYTLLLSGNHVVIAQLLTAGARYDAVKSFVPVARFAVLPSGLFVRSQSPYNSLQELLAYVRNHPDALTYASGGNGTPSHLAMELLKRRHNLVIRHIPYKGTPPAVTDLIGGQVDMLFTSIAGPMVQVKSGRLRLLAVSSPKRLPALADISAIAEAVPGYEFETWLGVSAPRGTPDSIVATLSAEIGKALRDPVVMRRMEAAGLTPGYLASAELSRKVEEEAGVYARVIKEANIKVE